METKPPVTWRFNRSGGTLLVGNCVATTMGAKPTSSNVRGEIKIVAIDLALNAGIPFHTPEVFFLGESAKPLGHKFHPEWYIQRDLQRDSEDEDVTEPQHFPTMIILVGLPGAGKTTFFRRFLQSRGYLRQSAHAYATRKDFIYAVDETVIRGTLVVIDDLNIDVESRAPWVAIASKYAVEADAYALESSTNLCLHNDTVRALGGHPINSEDRPVYPRTPFLDLVKRYQSPSTSEGFRGVHEVKFKWQGTQEELDIWKKFWI